MNPSAEDTLPHRLEAYYRLQARLYDATRWAFLFGRSALVEQVAALRPERVLEVGCGTGYLLGRLAVRLPQARLEGIDLSEDMLVRARRRLAAHGERVVLRRELFTLATAPTAIFEVVVLSYALSMMGGARESVLDAAATALKPGGQLAVVDFDGTPSALFRRWMALNHVELDGRLRAQIASRFELRHTDGGAAYAGLWRWGLWIARKPG